MTPREIEIRLVEVELTGRDRVRLDVVVATGPDTGPTVTMRTVELGDGVRPLLHRGPVQGWVDVAVWVSAATRPGVGALSELTDSSAVQMPPPLTTSAGGDRAQARLEAAVVAVGWVADVVDAAAAAVGTSVRSPDVNSGRGQYRATWLPGQAFGVGRHPGGGVVRAPGVTFRLDVADVAAPLPPPTGPDVIRKRRDQE